MPRLREYSPLCSSDDSKKGIQRGDWDLDALCALGRPLVATVAKFREHRLPTGL